MTERPVPGLWKELDQARKAQGLSRKQLHVKVNRRRETPFGTLTDQLQYGRQTSWEEMRPVVLSLGLNECEWKETFDRAKQQGSSRRTHTVVDAVEPASEPTEQKRRWQTAMVAAGVCVLGLVVAFVWPGWFGPATRAQELGCVRVSTGEVRVYDEPGKRKHSFVKYEGERIQFPTPVEEVTGSDGLRYRRVLTPSRRDGSGWVSSTTSNLTDSC